MTKFKVGDKVRILDVDAILFGREYFKNGDVTEVVDVLESGDIRIKKPENAPGYKMYILQDEFHAIELVEDSGDRHHDLSEEIAELKRRVSELEAQKEGEEYIEIDTKELFGKIFPKKSPNELRKQAIEEAKDFVAEISRKAKRNYSHTDGNYTYINKLTKPEIIINEEKRTVVVLAKGINSGRVWEKGIAKCDPSDVFNADIGKAIALGRAYGLDVSEFEQAPQPDEVVVGMKVGHYESAEVKFEDYTVGEVRHGSSAGGKIAVDRRDGSYARIESIRIISDSEAQY